MSGGACRLLGDAAFPCGASGGRRGMIGSHPRGPRSPQVSDARRSATATSFRERGDQITAGRSSCPAGKALLFAAAERCFRLDQTRRLRAGGRDSEGRNLIQGATYPPYSPPDTCFNAQGESLWACRSIRRGLSYGCGGPRRRGRPAIQKHRSRQLQLSANGSLVYVTEVFRRTDAVGVGQIVTEQSNRGPLRRAPFMFLRFARRPTVAVRSQTGRASYGCMISRGDVDPVYI